MDGEQVVDRMTSLGEPEYVFRDDVRDGLKFAAAYNETELRSSGDVQRLLLRLRHHPAVFGGLGFAFRNMFTPHIARLLAEIYDIRRFFKPGHSRSISRLKNYFRVVTPKRVRSLHGRTTQTLGDVRLMIALDAWRDHPMTGDAIGEDRPTDAYFPGFYYVMCNDMEQAHIDPHVFTAYAAWRTTVAFLQFVFWTWGQQVGAPRFDPEKLFRGQYICEGDVAQSFRKYISQLDLDDMEMLF